MGCSLQVYKYYVGYCPSSTLYGMAQKSVNWLMDFTLKYVRNFFITFTEFLQIVPNETLYVQCTTHNAVIPFYRLSGRFNIPVNTKECFRLTDFWGTLYLKDMTFRKMAPLPASRVSRRKDPTQPGPLGDTGPIGSLPHLTLITDTDLASETSCILNMLKTISDIIFRTIFPSHIS
jgi:hypothetical protein